MAKKKGVKAQGNAKFRDAMAALKEVSASKEEFGQLNSDGTANIDPKKLEALKKKLGKASWSGVRFVALNAPFKRRVLPA